MCPDGHIKFTRCCCTRQLIDYLCSKMRLRRGLMCPDLYCRIFSATITTYNYFIQPNLTLSNYEAQFLILSCCLFCLACTKESKVQESAIHISSDDISLCADNTLELGITETDFAIDCNFQSSTPWVRHYFRVYGCVNQETPFETGELSDSRYFGFEGKGPGTIQMGYHTDNYIYGMCIWSVIY